MFGVMTLLLVCALASAWIRSHLFLDVLKIPVGPSSYLHCYSGDGRFGGTLVNGESPPLKLPKWTARQFDASFSVYSFEVPYGTASLSYWPKVASLTVTAAYLLLFQPKSRNPKTEAVRLNQTGTGRHYFEVCLVASLILAHLDIVTAMQVAFW